MCRDTKAPWTGLSSGSSPRKGRRTNPPSRAPVRPGAAQTATASMLDAPAADPKMLSTDALLTPFYDCGEGCQIGWAADGAAVARPYLVEAQRTPPVLTATPGDFNADPPGNLRNSPASRRRRHHTGKGGAHPRSGWHIGCGGAFSGFCSNRRCAGWARPCGPIGRSNSQCMRRTGCVPRGAATL